MSVKLSNQQIDALIAQETAHIVDANTAKKKELRDSEEFKAKVAIAVLEYINIPPRFKKIITTYGRDLDEKYIENLVAVEEEKNLNLIPQPNSTTLKNRLLIATIDCENLEEVLKKAGFTCKL